MNIKINRTIATLLWGGAALLIPSSGFAGDEEGVTEENINRMVSEAQEVAKEWAHRIREWKSGEKQPATYLGVVIESVPSVLRDYVDLPKGVGLLFSSVAQDSPAEKAGLQKNDILVSFDGQLIINFNQFSTLIEMKGPGATVSMKVLRKGEEVIVDVTLVERQRRGSHFLDPDSPHAPDVPGSDEVGAFMEKIEEWIPGSVRVFVDADEQVHVDLEDLKEDLQDLKHKFKHIQILDGDMPGIVTEHGDLGARTTVIKVAEKNINYASDAGKIMLSSSDTGQYARVWDEEGTLIYEGDVPENYASVLPEKAVKLMDTLNASRNKLELESDGQHLEIHLNQTDIDPVTLMLN